MDHHSHEYIEVRSTLLDPPVKSEDLHEFEVKTTTNLPDVFFICEDHVFPAHKSKMRDQSLYMVEVLNHNPFSETLIVEGIKVEVFRAILVFIYTDTIDLNTEKKERLRSLLAASKKLRFESLLEHIWKEMEIKLTGDICDCDWELWNLLHDFENQKVERMFTLYLDRKLTPLLLESKQFVKLDEKLFKILASAMRDSGSFSGDETVDVILDWVSIDSKQRRRRLPELIATVGGLSSVSNRFFRTLLTTRQMHRATPEVVLILLDEAAYRLDPVSNGQP